MFGRGNIDGDQAPNLELFFSFPSVLVPGSQVFRVVDTLLVHTLLVDSTDMGMAKIPQEVYSKESQVSLNIFRCPFAYSRATS